MAEDTSGAGGAMYAVTTLLVVVLLLVVLYFSGVFSNGSRKSLIDANVNAPAISNSR